MMSLRRRGRFAIVVREIISYLRVCVESWTEKKHGRRGPMGPEVFERISCDIQGSPRPESRQNERTEQA